jgi:hypothetical protein
MRVQHTRKGWRYDMGLAGNWIGTVRPRPGEFSAKPLVMLIQSGQKVCIWRCCQGANGCLVYSTSVC